VVERTRKGASRHLDMESSSGGSLEESLKKQRR
jgi:hypothetical protein